MSRSTERTQRPLRLRPGAGKGGVAVRMEPGGKVRMGPSLVGWEVRMGPSLVGWDRTVRVGPSPGGDTEDGPWGGRTVRTGPSPGVGGQ